MICLCSGIRGEINVLVKVDLFNDLNRFRQSSCGVKFFCSKYLDHLLPFLPVLLFFIPSDDLFPPLSALLCSTSCLYLVILSEFSLTFWFCLYCSSATSIPRCYRAIMVHGFVEELVVNEDPEYQWIDRIRTPRASMRPDRDSSFSCQVLKHKQCEWMTESLCRRYAYFKFLDMLLEVLVFFMELIAW